MRKLLVYLMLFGVIVWIALSYLPPSLVTLPSITFPVALDPLFQSLLIGALIFFLTVQVWLVWTTVTEIRSGQQRPGSAAWEMQLSLFREALWTALPIVMTIGLVLASYQTWASLGPP